MEERNTSAKFRWDDTKAKTGGTGLCGLNEEPITPAHPKIENVKIGGTTIKIKAETEGFEEAREEAENLAEALEAFSPLVQIKNCKGCTFNIYPTQKIACEEYELEK